MNLEEMLVQERERVVPNPLADRTDHLVGRVRRRRRVRAAVGGVVGVSAVALLAAVVWRIFLPQLAVPPAEPVPVPTQSTEIRTLGDVPADSPLEPGPYVMSMSEATMSPVLTVPDGYSHGGDGWEVFVTDDTGSDGYSPVVAVWEIDAVYSHPCDPSSRLEPVGPSVADLANALAAQPMRNGSTPTPVTVGGYDGLYVELTVPDGIDVTSCPGGRFNSWFGRWQQGPGQVDMIWVLDVDGERIVLNAMHGPTAPPGQVDELRTIVSTATFTPR